MKAKRLFALLLSFVMVISMLPASAMAAAEPQIEVKVVEETLAGKDGVAVELYITTGNEIASVAVALAYDPSMLELVDAEGNAVDPAKANTALIVANTDFDFANNLKVADIDDKTAGLTFEHVSFSASHSYAGDLIDKVFLALKDGAVAAEAAETVRWATYEEATKTAQSGSVIAQDAVTSAIYVFGGTVWMGKFGTYINYMCY